MEKKKQQRKRANCIAEAKNLHPNRIIASHCAHCNSLCAKVSKQIECSQRGDDVIVGKQRHRRCCRRSIDRTYMEADGDGDHVEKGHSKMSHLPNWLAQTFSRPQCAIKVCVHSSKLILRLGMMSCANAITLFPIPHLPSPSSTHSSTGCVWSGWGRHWKPGEEEQGMPVAAHSESAARQTKLTSWRLSAFV